MGIKTLQRLLHAYCVTSLKNLPTTWGLKHQRAQAFVHFLIRTLKNLPTTWGLKQVYYQLLSE